MADIFSELAQLETPSLLLDEATMLRNIARTKRRAEALGVRLRPHLKTGKCVEVARRMMLGTEGPATVSTLAEAEAFAAAGVRDIFYAVGVAPQKLSRVLALRRDGVDIAVMLDSAAQARAVVHACAEAGTSLAAYIEIDADEQRAGLAPGDAAILEIGRILHDGGAVLRGVATHAGGSYGGGDAAGVKAFAERERDAVVAAAEALRAAGLPCPVVSVGATPTAHFAEDLTGVTEMRPGVFVFNDLMMTAVGVCGLEDIAISVLATVIGHNRQRGWVMVDAGWMAMSQDRGAAALGADYGYGVVCDVSGAPLEDLIMIRASQEHGVIARRGGGAPPELAIGARLRILPNHACATAAQHARYNVIQAEPGAGLANWPIIRGW